MKYSFFYAIILLIGVSCGKTDVPDTRATNVPDTDVIPAVEPDQTPFSDLYSISEQESLEYYQMKEKEILKGSPKDLSPVQFVSLMLNETEESVRRTILPPDSLGLSIETGAQVVVVQEEKIPDDSISGEIRFFKIRKLDHSWTLVEVSAVWSCYPGRGHQEYSTQPCL